MSPQLAFQHFEMNTKPVISVVTRFEPTKVTQFFVQDGKRIDPPAPAWKGFPETGGLSEEFCQAQPQVFKKRDMFEENGGWKRHLEILSKPMVLSLSIADNVGLPTEVLVLCRTLTARLTASVPPRKYLARRGVRGNGKPR